MGMRLSIMLLWTVSSSQSDPIVVAVRFLQRTCFWDRVWGANTALYKHGDPV